MTAIVSVSIEGNVAILTLDNPPLNVVTLALTAALSDALERIAADCTVRAVVLTGAGDRAFCAGSDITEFPGMMQPGEVLDKKLVRQNAIFDRLDGFPKPVVAAIAGLAFGGGLEIALCCDLIVIEETSRLALPEIKLGVFPSSGGPVRAARRIGETRAKEMILLGEPIDAATALSWGLVNRVVPTKQSLTAAKEIAAKLATRPTMALHLAKQAIDFAFDYPLGPAIRRSLQLSDAAFSGPEAAEGVDAFLAKRTPDFTTIPYTSDRQVD